MASIGRDNTVIKDYGLTIAGLIAWTSLRKVPCHVCVQVRCKPHATRYPVERTFRLVSTTQETSSLCTRRVIASLSLRYETQKAVRKCIGQDVQIVRRMLQVYSTGARLILMGSECVSVSSLFFSVCNGSVSSGPFLFVYTQSWAGKWTYHQS